MIADAPLPCCAGDADWCKACGGRRYRGLLGVARTCGALWAETTRERMRMRREAPPEPFPGTPLEAGVQLRVTLSVVEEVEVMGWLIRRCWEAGAARWAELVGDHSK